MRPAYNRKNNNKTITINNNDDDDDDNNNNNYTSSIIVLPLSQKVKIKAEMSIAPESTSSPTNVSCNCTELKR